MGCVNLLVTALVEEARHTPVQHQHLTEGAEHDVLGLQIPVHHGLGMGDEKPHPELPGLVSQTANEYYGRAFFARWPFSR